MGFDGANFDYSFYLKEVVNAIGLVFAWSRRNELLKRLHHLLRKVFVSCLIGWNLFVGSDLIFIFGLKP